MLNPEVSTRPDNMASADIVSERQRLAERQSLLDEIERMRKDLEVLAAKLQEVKDIEEKRRLEEECSLLQRQLTQFRDAYSILIGAPGVSSKRD
jgi:DNA-binding transcriptional regulator GbsR (MarR family)